KGTLTDAQLPEGAELPEEFAALEQESPPPQQPKPAPQAPLDPAYRQALLRMQAEGVQLPGSLLDLLEECEGVKSQTGKGKASVEESPEEEPTDLVDQESSDLAAAGRHAQAKAAAFADTDTPSGSGSAGKSKQSSTDSSDAGNAAALPLHTQPF